MKLPIKIIVTPEGQHLTWLAAGIAKSRTVWMAILGLSFDHAPYLRDITQKYVKPEFRLYIAMVFMGLIAYFRANPKQLKEAHEAAAEVETDLRPVVGGLRDALPTAGLSKEQTAAADKLLAGAESVMKPREFGAGGLPGPSGLKVE